MTPTLKRGSSASNASARDWCSATRGAADTLLFDGSRLWRQPAVPTEIVDTLGAGDAFIARFLAGVVRAEPFESALAAAAISAAETCRAFGAFGYGTKDRPSGPARPEEQIVSGLPTGQTQP